MPSNKSLQIVLNPSFASSDGWTAGSGWVHGVNKFTYTAPDTGTNTLQQDIVSLVEGATYRVEIVAQNITTTNGDAYLGFQLGGGDAKRLYVDGIFTGNDSLYLVCGSSLSSGLEVSPVNYEVGDSVEVNLTRVYVEHFKPSTNLDAVFVSGDIRVPATGTNEIVNGTFDTDTDWVKDTGWSIGSGVASCDGTQAITDITASLDPLTSGKLYLVKYDLTVTQGETQAVLGGNDTIPKASSGTVEYLIVSGGGSFAIRGSSNFIGTVDNIEVYEMTTGPIDEYPANGTFGGKTKYTSIQSHSDGVGGSQQWNIWWGGSNWFLSPDAGSLGLDYWDLSNAEPIGDFTPKGNATGTAETSYGPTDHTISSGSPGMETDGVSGYIDLKTSYDYLNDLRSGKFAIITVTSIDSGNLGRIWSTEGSPDSDSPWLRYQTVDDNVIAQWLGTSSIVTQSLNTDTGKAINITQTYDTSTARVIIDGGGLVSDSYNGLNAGSETIVMLGNSLDLFNNPLKAKFSFTSILDLSSVTVTEEWSTGLSQAINTAAQSSKYKATDIAKAARDYINLTGTATGVYWPLNEASAGDVSDYYILARDIADDSEYTEEFYGLVSPGGVTGTKLVSDTGYRGAAYRARYRGQYRPRYK